MVEGGLQFVRGLLGPHFVYHGLSAERRAEVLGLSLLLLNNCVVLMKCGAFLRVTGQFDLEEEIGQARRIFENTHGAPGLHYMKSH